MKLHPLSKDLTGQSFGRLKVVSLADAKVGEGAFWNCLCACGREKTLKGTALRFGGAQSCGCARKENAAAANTKHGKHNTQAYRSWQHMKVRCGDTKNPVFRHYGARGIKVCRRWLDGFAYFYSDMGDPPTSKHTIERINNDGDYCKENCKWATRKEQSANQRSNRKITIRGVTKILAEWCRESGRHRSSINNRLRRGLSPDEAIFSNFRRNRQRTKTNTTTQ